MKEAACVWKVVTDVKPILEAFISKHWPHIYNLRDVKKDMKTTCSIKQSCEATKICTSTLQIGSWGASSIK